MLATLATLPECVNHPRFIELVARCIVRPDDALLVVQATLTLLGGREFPPELRMGIVQGLDASSNYQLAKYSNASLDLVPVHKERRRGDNLLPSQGQTTQHMQEDERETSLVPEVQAPSPGKRTLRLVDVLGICRTELSPRLRALYAYLKSSTRSRKQHVVQRLIAYHFPLLLEQKAQRDNPPRTLDEVDEWVKQALAARMTIEQIFSATGLLPGERKKLREIEAAAQEESSSLDALPDPVHRDTALLSHLQQAEVQRLAIRAAIWKAIISARVESEGDVRRSVKFLGDVAFLRNIRGMIEAGVPVADLIDEVAQRSFNGIWPFQLVSAARALKQKQSRGRTSWPPCPQALPVLDAIFQRVMASMLPRKEDGTLYSILGMADVSSSMMIKLGGKASSATCMDASLSFSAAFSSTTRTSIFGGLAGSWASDFWPAQVNIEDGPLAIVDKVLASGGWGGLGTQVLTSFISLIIWLMEHPDVPRPEVVVVLSDMQFEPPTAFDPFVMERIPSAYRYVLNRPEMVDVPPLAAAIVLYREILGAEVSMVLWNLAAYEGSPVPSGMERVLLLSGFDANTLHSLELWLRAGSPGSAMPVSPSTVPSGDGHSNSSIEAVLYALQRF